jgi:tripeptidyl-peptidase-2
LGSKNLFDLFPRPLLDRLEKKRKSRFLKETRVLLTKANESVQTLTQSGASKEAVKGLLFLIFLDAQVRVAILEEFISGYADPGWSVDIVVCTEDEVLKVMVDTTPDGDLTKVPRMAGMFDYSRLPKFFCSYAQTMR